jgi:GMP synthase-like glutamine amidotransferase
MHEDTVKEKPMRIGILVCDRLPQEFTSISGEFDAMFRKLLAGYDDLEFVSYWAVDGELPERVDECDAYLITGSQSSAYDDKPWIHALKDFIVRLHEARRKTVGICFGHQIIAASLGGHVEKADIGWGLGVKSAQVVQEQAWMIPALPAYDLILVHQDQVVDLPTGAQRVATNDYCPNSAYIIDDFIFAMQAHPEIERDFAQALMEKRRDSLHSQDFDADLASLNHDLDATTIAQWISNFLRG